MTAYGVPCPSCGEKRTLALFAHYGGCPECGAELADLFEAAE